MVLLHAYSLTEVDAKRGQKWGKSGVEKPTFTRCMGYSMKLPFGTLLYFDERCGAKTRSGEPCKNLPMQLAGRCRMHGGAALRGPEHPRYKHGKYSKYKPVELDDLIAQYANVDVCALLAELASMPDPLADLEPFDLGALLAELGPLDLTLD